MQRFHKVIALSLLLVFVTLPQQVSALELSIVENGEGSSSSVEVTSSSETTVTQTGNADVTNNIEANSNTGNNVISEGAGSGTSSIETGSSKTVVNVVTEVNSNEVKSTNCCNSETPSTVTIANNGSNSTNEVTAIVKNNTEVVSHQTGNITTNIAANSNTGNNSIKQSSGDKTIKTGNAKTEVSNVSIANNSFVNVASYQPLALTIVIKNNGASSNNDVAVALISNRSIEILNSTNIETNISASSNTGNNTIDKGIGGAFISTGDATTIVSSKTVANISSVKVDTCCSKNEDPGDPGEPAVPPIGGGGSISTSSSTSSGGIGGGGGSVLGVSAGDVLPATGMNITLWATIFNVFMLIMGLYLRKKAARSPARA